MREPPLDKSLCRCLLSEGSLWVVPVVGLIPCRSQTSFADHLIWDQAPTRPIARTGRIHCAANLAFTLTLPQTAIIETALAWPNTSNG